MYATDAIGSSTTARTNAASSADAYADLTSEDYFKLLITQLTNQDPMEPTSNEELLQQIASIRDIESSTSLTSALESLTGQQQFGSASTMIGRFVHGQATPDGAELSGVVVGVRFSGQGEPVLVLDSGQELPLTGVTTIESPEQLGAAMIGKMVDGTDTRDPAKLKDVSGVVTSVRTGDQGEMVLELDTGEDIRLSDISHIGTADDTAKNPIAKVIDGSVDVIKGLFGV